MASSTKNYESSVQTEILSWSDRNTEIAIEETQFEMASSTPSKLLDLGSSLFNRAIHFLKNTYLKTDAEDLAELVFTGVELPPRTFYSISKSTGLMVSPDLMVYSIKPQLAIAKK